MATVFKNSQWDDLAKELHNARVTGVLLEPRGPTDLPGNITEAYYVQDRTISLSGREPRGWKLGATAATAQKAFGLVEPFSGPVLEDNILPSPAQIDASGFSGHLLEPEIAITIGGDIDSPLSVEEARSAIRSFHPAIEVINYRFRNGRAMDALGMITDLGVNGALVLGAAIADGDYAYNTLTLQVRINGQTIATRTQPLPEIDPVQALVWISRHLASRGFRLRSGDVITTGSQAGIIGYRPGDLVEADFGIAGTAVVQF
jgi:2-keto-4-pentenoate hydratase